MESPRLVVSSAYVCVRITSVLCDDTSLIAGDLNGITKVSCKVAKPLK